MDMPQHLGFISKLGLPYITGLSGLLDGTLLSWFCKLGHCGLAFEAGQHQSSTSILKHHAFINLSMMYSGFIINLDLDELKNFEEQLSEELQPVHKHFVLVERYVIDPSEDFEMVPGYSNFQKIFKGEILATNRHGRIKANMDANIFMPLYQNQGEDGFFIIKPKD
jgi:succinylglutamate desuccinylase